ncbi:MAG: ribosomal protein S18-alanine N-acetyltransferase [Clostridiales bacterium]|nr:ribosomal protein S18-alanine N-acetyltransferase [Clostridiales bacterium]
MIIRRMSADDVNMVAKIEAEVFSEPWSRESFLSEVETPNHIYLVAEEEEDILGYCGLWEVAGEGQITNVCVAPEHRGKAVATQMLEELLAYAQEMDIKASTLEVRVSNEPAIRLYEKLGFEEAGIRKGFYSHPKEDAMIMWKYD